jgi:hypothetical protein
VVIMNKPELTTITTTKLAAVTGAGGSRDLAESFGYDWDGMKGRWGKPLARFILNANVGGFPK